MLKILLGIGIIFTGLSAFADERIEFAFHQSGAKGVVSAAKAIEKESGAAAAVKALTQALHDEDMELRAAAAHALGTMGDHGRLALPELILALTRRDDSEEMSETLNDLGLGDIPIWLAEAALDQHDSDKAGDAYAALQNIGVGAESGFRDDRLLPILERGLRQTNFDMQWRAIDLLADMKAKAAHARPALVRLLLQEPTREKSSDEVYSSSEARARAASALGCIGAEPDQTVRLLTGMLKHPDPEIRVWSAIGLGQMGGQAKAAIPALIECLAEEKMILRPGGCLWSAHPDQAAATALVGIGSCSVPALVQALRAKQPKVRRHAVNALWYFSPEEAKPAVGAILQCLHDPDEKVRSQAAQTLVQVAPDAKSLAAEMVRLTHDKEPTVRIQAAQSLSVLNPIETIPIDALIRLLDDPDAHVRITAVNIVARLTPRAAVEAAIDRLLTASDASVREAAARMLAGIGPAAKAAVPALIELLKDRDSNIRCAACEALGKIGSAAKGATSSLIDLLVDKDSNVRCAAAEALGKIGPQAVAAMPAMRPLLHDEDPYVRQSAASALAEIGPCKTAVPLLTELLKDTDPGVRGAACEALGKIGPAAKASIPAVTELLDDKRPNVRRAAAEAIGQIAPEPAAISSLTKRLDDEDSGVRDAAADSIGKIGSPAIPALTELLTDRRVMVRQSAADAVRAIGPDAKAAVPALTKLLEERNRQLLWSAISALGKIGPDAKMAVPKLVELLNDQHVRPAAVEALGEIGPDAKAAVPALTGLLKDRDSEIREVAAAALKSIGNETK